MVDLVKIFTGVVLLFALGWFLGLLVFGIIGGSPGVWTFS